MRNLACFATLLLLLSAASGQRGDAPHLLLIVTDQQRRDSVSALRPGTLGPDGLPLTPHLDAIAREVLSGRSAPAGTAALAVRDPMGAYMAEVRRYPLLSREEEHELAKRWVETGDRDAGRRLVTSNLRLVVKLANEYRRGYQNLLDLVQEGNVGLLKAVDRFDPYRGIKLSTYAAWWIRAYILKYILANWRLVKLGTTQNQRKLFYNLNKQRRALEAAGVEPTSENLADALDVSTQEVVEMQKRLAAPDASLQYPGSKWTALHEAARHGSAAVARVLLASRSGAPPEHATAGCDWHVARCDNAQTADVEAANEDEDATETEAEAEEEAAQRIQAIHRGSMARSQAAQAKSFSVKQDAAAEKIQALCRGRQARPRPCRPPWCTSACRACAAAATARSSQ